MAEWDMPDSLAPPLEKILAFEYLNLRALSDEQAAVRPAELDSWSRKEELGHLIDSAVNNHIRFVRASLEPEYTGQGYARTVGCAHMATTNFPGRRCLKCGVNTTAFWCV